MALKVDITEQAIDIGDEFVVLLTHKYMKAFQPNREQRERLHKGIQLDLNAGHSFREEELGQMLAGVGDKSRPGWRRIQNGLNRILEHALGDNPAAVPVRSARPVSIVAPTTTAAAKKPVDSAPPPSRPVTTLREPNNGLTPITPYLVYHYATGRYEQVGPLPKKRKDSAD